MDIKSRMTQYSIWKNYKLFSYHASGVQKHPNCKICQRI